VNVFQLKLRSEKFDDGDDDDDDEDDNNNNTSGNNNNNNNNNHRKADLQHNVPNRNNIIER
jgi:hypothetical protein